MDLSAAEIAQESGGRLLSGDPERRFEKISLDSRQVPTGSLFAALPGARVDGHDFLSQALDGGASGALVMRPPATSSDAVVIQVEDTTNALQQLASNWRQRLRATVIGIAGSNGKTTTKETTAAVLRRAGATWATPGNANSQVGAPLALLDTPLDTDFLVLELGTSAPGELSRLASMARPHHAVVTAAFAEHLEWLGSIEGVIDAETEILTALEPGGRALIGSAEPGLVRAARRHPAKIESLGRRPSDDWQLENVRTTRAGTEFHLRGPGHGMQRWELPLLGEPAAWAGAFSVAIANILGMGPEAIARGLSDARPAAHRLAPLTHPERPLLVLDDCYNSNPASCIAAIDTAIELTQAPDRLILVIGDMLELGDASDDAHREVGEAIAARVDQIDSVIAVGPESRSIARITSEHGAPTHAVDDAEAATARVRALIADGNPVTVLAKASRSIGLDKLVESLMKQSS